jgi:hypothetical protein
MGSSPRSAIHMFGRPHSGHLLGVVAHSMWGAGGALGSKVVVGVKTSYYSPRSLILVANMNISRYKIIYLY